MIRTDLHYHRPTSAGEVTDLLLRYDGDVAVLGGGTQLLPLMNRNDIAVSHVVDLRGLGLRDIVVKSDAVSIEALVTYSDVLQSAELDQALPLIGRVAHGITGGRQLRNTGTIAGSACFAMPGSDMPAALVGLEATYRLHGPNGFRDVDASDFYRGAFSTVLGPGEFLHSISFDRRARRTGYCKVKHSSGSWPIVTATAVEVGASRWVTLGSAQAVPLRVDLSHVDGSDEVESQVAAAISEPWSDVLAPGRYRARIAGVVASRALVELEATAR